MKLKVIIVDDEPMSRSFLERYCEKFGDLEVAGSFEDASTALTYLHKNEIDILFLDVEMPDVSGFQLLDQMLYLPKVILTTSKTDYAFDAFQYGVADYIKKPITYNRFQEAVTKIKDSLVKKAAPAPAPKNTDVNLEEIFIKADGKLTRLNFQEILYIESLGDYVKYFTATKNYVTLSTLKAVEEKMTGNKFMKVHRSYIVNLQKIKDIQDNTLVIEGRVIPISKSLKSEVMNRINVV
jgi:two-component system, LytTR family, response regulator LytT